MCKLHTSRLMRGGEYALWRGGRIIRSGNVGEHIDDIAFDAVSLSIDDGVRLLERTGGVLTAEMARATLSTWWE